MGLPDTPLPFTGGRIAASEQERRFVERRFLKQHLAAPGLSFAVLLGGFSLQWPRVVALGLLGLGGSAMWIGGLAVKERRLLFMRGGTVRREHRYVIYEGLAAIPYGLTYLEGGASLAVAAMFFFAGGSLERLRSMMLARPSLALLPAGFMLASYGLGFVIGFVRRAGSAWQRVLGMLLDAPARLGGLILIAWGLAALAVGATEALSPAIFNQWFQWLFGNPWPFSTP